MVSQSAPQSRALRLPAVQALTGYSRSTLWRLAKAGDFPTPFKLGARAVAWDQAEVEAWLASRKATRSA